MSQSKRGALFGSTLLIYHELKIDWSQPFVPEVTNTDSKKEEKEGKKEEKWMNEISGEISYIQCLPYSKCSINTCCNNEQMSSLSVTSQATWNYCFQLYDIFPIELYIRLRVLQVTLSYPLLNHKFILRQHISEHLWTNDNYSFIFKWKSIFPVPLNNGIVITFILLCCSLKVRDRLPTPTISFYGCRNWGPERLRDLHRLYSKVNKT